MRSLLILSVVLAVVLGAHAYSSSWGRRINGDFLLSSQTEVQRAVKNKMWNVNIDFPRAGTVNYYNISAIFVYDNFKNNSGAAPALWSGGPGYRFATINLRGQVSQGIDSTVQIFGR